MASNIKIKRSEVSGNPSILGAGELAYSALADNGSNGGDRLYIGMGTESAGNAVNHVVIGGKYFTDMITAATASNTASTLVKRDASGNFVAGTITANLSGNATTANTWQTARSITLTGDAAATFTSVDGSANASTAITLATVNSNVGQFGSTTAIPIFTVNAKGLITAVSTAAISTSFNVYGNSGVTAVAGGDSFEIVGGTGVTTTAGVGPKVTINIGQAVSTTSNVTFNNITAGILTASSITTAGSIDASSVTASTFNGSLNGNAATATKWAIARSLSLTGDGAATLSSVDGTGNVSAGLTLATVNSNVGSFGGTTAIPVIAVNGKGLVTSIYTVAIATSLAISGNSGTDTVSLADNTLAIVGGTGVSTTVTDNTVTVNIGQAVSTTSNVTFNNVTVDGTLNSNDITATNISIDGNATITGNLTIQGTTTTVNSTAVAITDVNLTLAKDAVNSVQADGAGLTVAGANATLTYISSSDRWNFNKDLVVGSGVVVGDVFANLKGIADSARVWTTARDLSLTGDATATLASVNGFDNVSAALTLATVNSNVGSFGSATTVPNFTVNAKGLITAAGSTAIPTATTSVLGLASFNSDNFTVTSGAVTIATIDGGTY